MTNMSGSLDTDSRHTLPLNAGKRAYLVHMEKSCWTGGGEFFLSQEVLWQ